MSVYSNGFVFQDGVGLSAVTGKFAGQPGLNPAFDDALSMSLSTSQTLGGPIVFAGLHTTIGGEATNTNVLTGTGNYTAVANDRIIVVKKTVAATTTITLPSNQVTGRLLTIKDGSGNAQYYPTTIVASQSLDGNSATGGIILNEPYASVELVYNGTAWNIVGGYGFDINGLHTVFVQNVKSYGAAGDGTTDDTLAIQTAAALAGGGTVYFPPGTYLISASTGLPSNCVVMGPATIVAAAAAKWASGAVAGAFTNNGGSNIQVRDLAFVWPEGSANFGGGTAYILQFTGSSNVSLTSLVSDGGNSLVYFSGTAKTSVSACLATNVASHGIHHLSGAATAAVIGNYISTLAAAGAGATGISFQGMDANGVAAQSSDFKAFGNTIYVAHNSGGAGISVQAATGGSANKIIITNNHIQLNNVPAMGVQISGPSANGLIHDNIFEGCSGANAAVSVSSTGSNYSVYNNRVDTWQAGSGGVFAVTSTASLIYNNAVTNGSTPVIGVFDSSSRQYNNSAAGGLAPCAAYDTVTIVTTSNYTALLTDRTIIVNKATGSATTITLPATPSLGLRYSIKDGKGDAATENISIAGNGNNIDGASTAVLNQAYAGLDVVWNGTSWSAF